MGIYFQSLNGAAQVLSVTLQSAPCGAELGLEIVPDPCGPKPREEAEASWATLHPAAH